jgi:hypothetical protein
MLPLRKEKMVSTFSKASGIIALVNFVFCTLLTPCESAVKFKEYYQGLPDFEKMRPFSETNALLQKELRKEIGKISLSEQTCPKEPLGHILSGAVKVCKSADHSIDSK